MRINIETCTDIEILRREGFRLTSVIEALVHQNQTFRQCRERLAAVDDVLKKERSNNNETLPADYEYNIGYNAALYEIRKAIESTDKE